MLQTEIVISEGIVADPARCVVTRNEQEIFLTPQLFVIFVAIAGTEHGLSTDRLFDRVYADATDGGPDTGRKAVAVQKIHLNKRLAPLRIAIASDGQGHRPCIYRLVIGE
jgi:hypothetical protein